MKSILKSQSFRQIIQEQKSLQSEDERETTNSCDSPLLITLKPKPLFKTNCLDHYNQNSSTNAKLITKLSRFSTQRNLNINNGDIDNEPRISSKEFNGDITQYNKNNMAKEIEENVKKIEIKLRIAPKLKQIKWKPNSLKNLKEIGKSKSDKLIAHPFRHLIFNPLIQEQIFQKHLIITQKGLIYSRKCLKGPSDKYLESKQIQLKCLDESKLNKIFLDLDETLIHACNQNQIPQTTIKYINDNNKEVEVGINIRPYCLYFLQELSQYYSIYVYTASSQQYAQAVVNLLDPNQIFISDILNRFNCLETQSGYFIKDLRIIKNLDLTKTLIVDNLVHSFGLQIENGVPILEWQDNTEDKELKYLLEYLLEASEYSNLRDFNIAHMQLDKLLDFIVKL